MPKTSKKRAKAQMTIFSDSAIRRLIEKHKVGQRTRVSEGAVEGLREILEELGGWIVREAERIATNGSRATIGGDDVNGAVGVYFARRG